MPRTRAASAALAGVIAVVLVGCASGGTGAAERPTHSAGTLTAGTPASGTATGAVIAQPAPATPAPATPAAPSPEPPPGETPRTRTAVLAIPSIGVTNLRVVPYEGTTDDWPGTRIQNRGVAASPYGERGGVGPGATGNYLVTAHRLSSGGPLRDLPSLKEGESVFVTAGGTVHEYRITDTRKTSFRSARSLAEQRAAVPGKPGERPTKAMITLSTCATPEDNAVGNFWRDDRGNPEHRIDKIGVLVSSRPAPGQ
ncbi:class E sortase [Streptomyces ficellus]|uniref:Class E sortase n=1 Tax=Streptomyces ficellus TaxID=1977088 RepID=A0ABT7ZE87_9ACTN|nr:class E sortase [Streptomyces ficellus]MDN3297567.1 class E sortase [Streptomyces ficellus]